MIQSIQFLRAIAALAVVIFHLPDFGHDLSWSGDLHKNLIGSGAAGVDLFFVISGFIMAHTFARRPSSPAEFMTRRILRIAPLYWAVTCTYWAVLAIGSAHFRDNYMSAGHLLSSLAFVSQPAGYENPFILPGWTLEFEMLFYVLFALSISLFARRPLVPLAAILVVLAPVSGLYIILEFVLGIGAFFISRRLSHPHLYVGLLLGGGILFLGVIASGFNLAFEGAGTSLARTLAWGGPAFLIVLGAIGIRQRIPGLLLYLGDASYSIYLTHGIAGSLCVSVFGTSLATTHPLAAQGISLLICIVLGCVVFAWVEKPLLRWLRSNVSKRSVAPPAIKN